MEVSDLSSIATQIRRDILSMSTKAGSGHPTSSLSAVELMTVLFFRYLKFDMKDLKKETNDRVIFSKGHASPLFYALYKVAGVLTEMDLRGYRTFESPLEGHPTPRFPYAEAATGSLGQGLSIGLGEALGLTLAKSPGRVYVLSGDGELAEGSVWEAAALASRRKIGNLSLIVDVNGLGQSDPTMYEFDLSVYARRFEAFGWQVIPVENGNNPDQVVAAFEMIKTVNDTPAVILAKTTKGAGVSFLENKPGWHGKALSQEELDKALKELT